MAEQETSFNEVLVDFSVANLLKSDCPQNDPYCYPDGNSYPRPRVEQVVQIDADELDTVVPKDGVQQFGADYIRLKSEQPLQLAFAGSKAGQWELRLIGLQNGEATVTPVDPTTTAVFEPANFERLYLAIINTAPVHRESNCGYHNYTLALADTAYSGTVEPPPVPEDPGPYIPPIYTDDPQAEDAPWPSPDIGRPIAPAEVSLELLYAGYLPTDYDFDAILSYDEGDLGQWRDDYAPGPAPIITLAYAGPVDETYIAITTSVSPYETIDEWVEIQGYFENHLRLIDNHPVFLVDYSEVDDDFSSATFVYQDLFVAIDGTFDAIEMQQVVAGLLARNRSP